MQDAIVNPSEVYISAIPAVGFSSIALFSFNSVYCIDINNKLYLYQQASIQCYQLWQYFIIFFIAIWIIPFCFVLYIATNLLHQCEITPNQYLAALTFPPLALPFWIISKLHNERELTKTDAMTAKHLLLVVNEPFKKSSSKDGSRICWESILILRSMLLVVLKTFIISPIAKLYPMIILLFVFIIQHVTVAPFDD